MNAAIEAAGLTKTFGQKRALDAVDLFVEEGSIFGFLGPNGAAAKAVPGTFFLTGNWAATSSGGVAQIVAAGHRVANHSMTHPGFTSLCDQLIAQQVLGAEQTILAAGADPSPFFRFP